VREFFITLYFSINSSRSDHHGVTAGRKLSVQMTVQAVSGIINFKSGNWATVITASTTGITPVSRTAQRKSFSFKL
jgi:hypothetical protein